MLERSKIRRKVWMLLRLVSESHFIEISLNIADCFLIYSNRSLTTLSEISQPWNNVFTLMASVNYTKHPFITSDEVPVHSTKLVILLAEMDSPRKRFVSLWIENLQWIQRQYWENRSFLRNHLILNLLGFIDINSFKRVPAYGTSLNLN